ncbi:MAG: hypothetical protein GY874_12440 [Desulfobacteraceae bacterium]|nr:hypothetical protein [Desulfobacteraceae bacterium]
MPRECVEVFVDGREAWKIGFSGFFSQIKGNVITVVLTIILSAGAPWWMPKNISTTKHDINLLSIITVLIIIIGVSLAIGFMYLKKRSIRSLDIKYQTHQLEHYLRDHQSDMFRLSEGNPTLPELKQIYDLYLSEVSNKFRNFFRVLIKDNTIEIAIRLAKDTSTAPNVLDIKYKTVVRTDGYNNNRGPNSTPISPDEGTARFLIEERDSKKVLIYNDIFKAAEKGAYKLTANDRNYRQDTVSMAIAPLNGWDGNELKMIGILIIASRKKETFSVKDVDSVSFIADMFSRSLVNINTLFSEHITNIGRS